MVLKITDLHGQYEFALGILTIQLIVAALSTLRKFNSNLFCFLLPTVSLFIPDGQRD